MNIRKQFMEGLILTQDDKTLETVINSICKELGKEGFDKNDIDKFLKDIVTMGGLTDLADFEKQYPHFAQKVACMAEAIGHTTALTTKC